MKKLICMTFIISLFLLPTTVFANTNQTSKEIYLTFDDGISNNVTSDILDILDKECVKATFFLIGNTLENNAKCLNRIHTSGHSIGLHSFSHNRNAIYKSKNAFIEEMNKTNDILFNIIGVKSFIIRFPFGTYNNSFKLNRDFESFVHLSGFQIYDWNVDSLDGQNAKLSPYKIYKNSISDKDTIILLMHSSSINKNSALALPDIIKYYKNEGYIFKTITPSTPEMYKLKRISLPNFLPF